MSDLITENLNYYERLIKLLDKNIDGKSDELGRGACETLSQYKALAGEIEGLRLAKALAKDVAHEMQRD
jgi:hypothetical protein